MTGFSLDTFLPYLLNQASVQVSEDFAAEYKSKHGLLRTEWRVLAHLGPDHTMTAKEICDVSRTHKTKISRAVFALEKRRWLMRKRDEKDRRKETLSLTKQGCKAYQELTLDAQKKTQTLREALGQKRYDALLSALRELSS